ncbi:hypothetical protein BGW38_002155 [Lunasporangiospora selenospora]|uniref:Uncharacterized protein n=1 Tax=Lunasporangiospora selenospora TaxID=979761 RepID=A0A9P6FSS3_9FUNG|nr:hypothetical protein BGW38_002155 [Lunasporangiospora selenospora]
MALVLFFNVANLQNIVRFNIPQHFRIVFTALYALYVLIGLLVGFLLYRTAENKRFRSLIILYWVLIVITVAEGIYFGVVIANQKAKLLQYCVDGAMPANAVPPDTSRFVDHNNNNTLLGNHPIAKGFPNSQCRKVFIGTFYIMGPGGWIILHSVWILLVVFYSKALRQKYPTDEEDQEIIQPGRQTSQHSTLTRFFKRPHSKPKTTGGNAESEDEAMPDQPVYFGTPPVNARGLGTYSPEQSFVTPYESKGDKMRNLYRSYAEPTAQAKINKHGYLYRIDGDDLEAGGPGSLELRPQQAQPAQANADHCQCNDRGEPGHCCKPSHLSSSQITPPSPCHNGQDLVKSNRSRRRSL